MGAHQLKPAVGDTWYRFREQRVSPGVDEYGDRLSGLGPLELLRDEYRVEKVTPKGVWLRRHIGDFSCDGLRFVLNSARKRFACPTEQQALESFIARKTRQASIFNARAETAEQARGKARVMLARKYGEPVEAIDELMAGE